MHSTLGARLRSQREHHNIALETIADETKINLALLDGLERDDVSRWPGGLFRRAYVRAYAQRIGLDPEQVLGEFLATHPDPISTSAVEALAQNARAKRPKTRIGLMIAGLASRRSSRTDDQPAPVTPTSLRVDHIRTAVNESADPYDAPELPLDHEAAPVTDDAAPVFSAAPAAAAEEPQTAGPRLRMVVPAETSDVRREIREIEHTVASAARLCTRIACARDDRDLSHTLEATVDLLDALGVVLWVFDPDREVLIPALAHGYSDELLAQLPEVNRREDNSIAAAFRFGQKQVVRAEGDATGAFVSPLLTPEGCVGALALEFAGGAEQHELVQTLATLITAQLSTLFVPVPQGALDQEWTQPAAGLVAS